MLGHLGARAIEGVERVEDGVYRRSIALDGRLGSIEVAHRPERNCLAVAIRFPELSALPGIVARARRLFDVGADIETIGAHLARDPLLAPLVARRPGLRALAAEAVADPQLFRPFGTVEEAVQRLRAIRGVGEWTAQYIALRALRETDAFPASDIGLL